MEPQEVARKEFLTGMRGYVREEVRGYLRVVSEELFRRDEIIADLRLRLEKVTRALENAERRLDELDELGELDDAGFDDGFDDEDDDEFEEAGEPFEARNGQSDLDRATLVRLVGEEASAILSSADGAAGRIRFEAERYAASVRDGLVSTRRDLSDLHMNLSRLLDDLQRVEEEVTPTPEPDEGPATEIHLDEGLSLPEPADADRRTDWL